MNVQPGCVKEGLNRLKHSNAKCTADYMTQTVKYFEIAFYFNVIT